MIPINFKGSKPIWEQIKEEMKKEILMGVWESGEQLPSVRSLATELGINPNTIQRAYSELEREGLTYTVVGKGCFVEEDLTKVQEKKEKEAFEKLSALLLDFKDMKVGEDRVLAFVSEFYKEEKDD